MRFLQGILLSLGVHLLLVWGSQFLPIVLPQSNQRERIEFEVVSPTENNKTNGQVVRQPEIPKELLTDTSKDDLAFLSEKTQRVKKQMQAQASGMTANRAPKAQQEASPPKQSRPRRSHKDLFSVNDPNSDISLTERLREREERDQTAREGTSSRRSPLVPLPTGRSTIGESLPTEVEVGSFTALNTDKYLYYSFFIRVEELIRYRWEDSVKESIQRTPRGAFQAQLTENWISTVEIQLKPNGEFHRALLLKSSNIDGFDWAAIDSFAQAGLFPNPPAELIEPDGLIRLRYSFNVRYRPTALVKQ